jgi:hypothetical protein
MTNTNFDFDPLPGDQPAAEQPAEAPVERKKRGPKKGSKRGPRRVSSAIIPPGSNAMAKAQKGTKAAVDAVMGRPHKPAEDLPPEYVFIRQMMKLTEADRARVLVALNKVFGQ